MLAKWKSGPYFNLHTISIASRYPFYFVQDSNREKLVWFRALREKKTEAHSWEVDLEIRKRKIELSQMYSGDLKEVSVWMWGDGFSSVFG